jgi:hypothetical protein
MGSTVKIGDFVCIFTPDDTRLSGEGSVEDGAGEIGFDFLQKIHDHTELLTIFEFLMSDLNGTTFHIRMELSMSKNAEEALIKRYL